MLDGWASLSILIFIVGGQTFCVEDYLNDQNGPHTVMLNRHLGPTGHQRKYETHADRRKEINTCIAVFFCLWESERAVLCTTESGE